VAQGHVVLESDGKLIRADVAKFDKKSGSVFLEGNVFIRYGEDWIKGEEVHWNLDSESGYVKNGLAFFSKNHFYVQARSLKKQPDGVFVLKNGFFTTCNPVKPDWKITYRKLEVPGKGFAKARGVTFRVGSVPIVYVPWGIFPVRKDRESGILSPTVGLSELQGFEIEVPYFWAIDKSKDMTLFLHYLQKRGVMLGTEYRWSTSDWGEGIFIANCLHDEADKKHLLSQHLPFQRKDRYWIRGVASFDVADDLLARMKLDIVSDKNFLKEFEKGSPSYDYTDRAFTSFLGSGILQDKTMTARESNLYVTKFWEGAELSLNLHYWDENAGWLKDETIETLPEVRFWIPETFIPSLSAYYSMDSSLAHFWREDGTAGTRLRIAPSLNYPANIKFLNITPRLDFDFASYHLYDKGTLDDSTKYRAVPSVGFDANMQMERDFVLSLGSVSKLKHVIIPELSYEFTPDIGQDEVPFFDRFDYVPHHNRIRYGFSSFVTAEKTFKGDSSKVTTYEEWLRLKMFQYYQFGEQADYITEDPVAYEFTQMEEDNGFSDVYVELDVTPHRYIELSYDLAVSPEEDFIRRHDIMLAINTITGQTARFDYRYREESTTDEFIADFSWNVAPWLTVSMYHDYSFDRGEMLKQGYGVIYRRNCWAVTVSYEKEGEDRRFFVGVNLVGLGQRIIGH